jgi:hypothetical protein
MKQQKVPSFLTMGYNFQHKIIQYMKKCIHILCMLLQLLLKIMGMIEKRMKIYYKKFRLRDNKKPRIEILGFLHSILLIFGAFRCCFFIHI